MLYCRYVYTYQPVCTTVAVAVTKEVGSMLGREPKQTDSAISYAHVYT